MLPVRKLIVKLPERSNVTGIDAETREVLLEGNYTVLPARMPSVVGTESGDIAENPAVYESVQSFPREWFNYTESNGFDPSTKTYIKYLVLNLFPLRFLPAEHSVIMAESISVKIRYIEPATEAESLSFPSILKNLIITSPTLQSHASQLASWKNTTGVPSKVLTTTWIYSNYFGIDNQEKIRNCIKSFFTSYGISYVTIFGDADQVPVRYVYVPDDLETYIATDLYYADLDGTWDDNGDGLYADQRFDNVNCLPEVYVGRISVSTVEHAQTVVKKVKTYQQRFDASQDWTRRVVLAAGTCSGDGFTNLDKNGTSILKDYIANIVEDKEVIKLYESSNTLTTENMRSEINKGALFVNFAGHGDPGSIPIFSTGWLFDWVIPGIWWTGFGISDVQSLANSFRLPVVTTMSCSTARFDDTDCIGEWFIAEPDGGAIAYFGSTRIAYGYMDEWAPYGFMGEMDRKIYDKFDEGYTRTGEMWGEDVREYVLYHLPVYRSASPYDIKTVMEFVLLGDPMINVGQTWEASTVYVELASNKLQSGSSWTKVSDPSSWSGLVKMASTSAPNGAWLYGPYMTQGWDEFNMLGKPYICSFKLKVSSNLAETDVVYIDVAYNASKVLKSIVLKASDFSSSDSWQVFQLNFTVPTSLSAGLEFRIRNLNNGITDVYVDFIQVRKGWDISTAYVESATNKPQSGSSWSKVEDPSSFSGLVMKAPVSATNGGVLFGPYITVGWNGQSMLARSYVVTFRLKVTSNISSSHVAYIDVCYNCGIIISSRYLRSSDFLSKNSWQDFQLHFFVPKSLSHGLEFRVKNLNRDTTDLFVDLVQVREFWDTSTIYMEAANSKLQYGSSWTIVGDNSSWSGLVMKASASSANSAWLYGPYIKTGWDGSSMLGKSYVASFRLKVQSNLSSTNVVYVDVCYNAGKVVLASMNIKTSDFKASNTWQDFQLNFTAPSSMNPGLEFRISNFNNGITDIFLDEVRIRRAYWVLFKTSPESIGSITYNGTRYIDDQSLWEISPSQSFTKYATVNANIPAGFQFEFWTTTSSIHVANVLESSTTLQVKGSGTLTATFSLTDSSVIYFDAASSKPQSGNSWQKTSGDPQSVASTVVRAPISAPNGDNLFGPYLTKGSDGLDVKQRSYTAVFRLKVSSRDSVNDVVLIDVCSNMGTILNSLKVKGSDFALSDTWQDFQLNFTVPTSLTYGLEFRIRNLNNGITDLFADCIKVRKLWDESTAYMEGAFNKPQSGSSWTKVCDYSSWSGQVMKASVASVNDGWLYGPYITTEWSGESMLGRSYTAFFRLKVTNRTSTSNVVYIDVCCNAGAVLSSMSIKASDFSSSNTWQSFPLTFTVPGSLLAGLEFRVRNLNNGVTDVFADQMRIVG